MPPSMQLWETPLLPPIAIHLKQCCEKYVCAKKFLDYLTAPAFSHEFSSKRALIELQYATQTFF